MNFSINDEHLQYAENTVNHEETTNKFLADLKAQSTELFEQLGKNSYAYFEHILSVSLRNHAPLMVHPGFLFLRHACWILAALYAANGEKIPPIGAGLMTELLKDCDKKETLQKRYTFLSSINNEWAEGSFRVAQQTGFCKHGLGPIYALAEAFIISVEKERGKEELKRQVDEGMKRLSPKIKEFIEGLNVDGI